MRHFVSSMWRRLIYPQRLITHYGKRWCCACLWLSGLLIGQLHGLLLLSRSRLLQHCRSGYPHKRFKRLISSARRFAGCSLVTQLLLAESIPTNDLTGVAALLGVTAEISPLHARLLPASLIAAIFTLSLAGYMPVTGPLLIYALGAMVTTGFGSGYGAGTAAAQS